MINRAAPPTLPPATFHPGTAVLYVYDSGKNIGINLWEKANTYYRLLFVD